MRGGGRGGVWGGVCVEAPVYLSPRLEKMLLPAHEPPSMSPPHDPHKEDPAPLYPLLCPLALPAASDAPGKLPPALWPPQEKLSRSARPL